ncbi:MAG: DUF2304 domain-containing protein [Desulfobulbaceae bacterium]|nr:DUF2304 domain-containing protein [Desulfobulbaceae bacterium]
MISYQITSALIAVLIAVKIFFLVRRDALHTRYALWWFIIAILVLIAGVFPKLIDVIAHKLGVSYPPILVIVSGMGLILIKMLNMDIDRSRQEQKLRRLVQKLAILEEEKYKKDDT